AGRAVTPLGEPGDNYLLRAYLGGPLERTEHYYTPAGVLGTDSNSSVTVHTYIPAEESQTGSSGMLSHTDIYYEGTDSNDDTTYILDDDEMDYQAIPLEESVDYLPNEAITVITYQPTEVNVDELDVGCYIYVKADFDRVQEKYLEEMNFIDGELKTAGEGAIILSLNSKRREELFDALTKNRTPYIGDNSKVGALLEALPVPPSLNLSEGFRLQTMEQPYSLRFSYEMSTDILSKEDGDTLYFNAAMLFYAVGNLEEIAVDVQNPGGVSKSHFCVYTREEMEEELPDLSGADYEDDEAFRDSLVNLYPVIEQHLSTAASIEKYLQ
ncbi:MAG: DUF4825 domain-containing protein, partial [Lachnospiraceae bacterium]|nr:DUF4825 domain-containing protein [Lachnospiraceae bacterium]